MSQDKYDSVIRELMQLQEESADELDSVLDMTGRAGPRTGRRMAVLVRFRGDLDKLERAGFAPRTIAGDIASGEVLMSGMAKLAKLDEVLEIEAARPLWRELNVSIPEIGADLVHNATPSNRGAGVIVGIVDSGIDITHPSFLTAGGQTRIRFLWDQALTPNSGESNPAGFSYGVEYTRADINAALAASNPASVVRHTDSDGFTGHGTHVTGIAAGDGSAAGNGQPAFTFVGTAPEADIILVRNTVSTEAFGDSATTLDAIQYIFDKASTLRRPCVINLSQGDNIGPHDGTSLLEQGIDALLGPAGRILVKSAGNEGARSRHAHGTVPAGGTETVQFAVDPGDTTREIIDIWYDGGDRFRFQITPPGGTASAAVDPGTTTTLTLDNGNTVFVDSVVGAPGNGDNRIFLTLRRGTAATIQQGVWTLTLNGRTVRNGDFHAWIERGNPASTAQFVGTHVDANFTISIPGTAQEVITVGSYVNSGPGAGNLSTFSSRGPTRDGRNAPTLSAPGENVMSARATGIALGTDLYHSISGTSMAAPHVAGTAALMLNVDSTLTQADVRHCLQSTARADAQTGATPDPDSWGAGKLDAEAAVACARPLPKLKIADDGTRKVIDDGVTVKVLDDGGSLKILDDPTTIKVLDDGGTVKVVDDGGTIKVIDDGGPGGGTPNKRFDDVKAQGLDKNPISDRVIPRDPIRDPVRDPGRLARPSLRPLRGNPARPSGETAGGRPFILATPHHAEGWSRSYPGAQDEAVAELEATLVQLADDLTRLNDAVAAGERDPQVLAALDQTAEQYEALEAEYRALTAQGGQAGRGRR